MGRSGGRGQIDSWQLAAGSGRRAADSGQRAAGSGQRTAVSGQRAAGSGQRAAGSGQRAAGSGQRAADSGQRAAGSGQRATGSGQRMAGSRSRASPDPLAAASYQLLSDLQFPHLPAEGVAVNAQLPRRGAQVAVGPIEHPHDERALEGPDRVLEEDAPVDHFTNEVFQPLAHLSPARPRRARPAVAAPRRTSRGSARSRRRGVTAPGAACST